MLFKLLQEDLRKPRISSVKELIDMDFTLIANNLPGPVAGFVRNYVENVDSR